MASDYGDEAGEKLFDWMLQLGQKAGDRVAENAADRFSRALQHAKDGKPDATTEPRDGKEWARLDMAEFKEIEGYPKLQQVISDRLRQDGIEHIFFDDVRTGKTYLLFKTADAAKLSESFDELIGQTQAVKKRVREALGKDQQAEKAKEIELDEEPLEAKAEKARGASAQMEHERSGGKGLAREGRFQENRGK